MMFQSIGHERDPIFLAMTDESLMAIIIKKEYMYNLIDSKRLRMKEMD
jgi:hypothetical protein